MSTAVEVKPSMGDMVDSYPVLKARLLEELKPVEEDPLRPRIVNQWMQIGFCRAVMLHNSTPCEPTSECTGEVSVTFQLKDKPGPYDPKPTYCQGCQQPVTVSITTLLLELDDGWL